MRILLADDHPLFRDGVASLLLTWGHEVVGQAGTADEAIRLCHELDPDLVLMDVRMPGSGLTATREIMATAAVQPTGAARPAAGGTSGRRPAIVMLTASEDEDDLFEAIKAGAHGYLLKNLESTQFRAMLDAVERGEAAITPATAVRIIEEFRDREGVDGWGRTSGPADGEAASGGPDRLTERELEVLGLVTSGLRNKEIAARLGVSENTAKFHLRNILEKLHAGSRTELAARALREGLLPPGVEEERPPRR